METSEKKDLIYDLEMEMYSRELNQQELLMLDQWEKNMTNAVCSSFTATLLATSFAAPKFVHAREQQSQTMTLQKVINREKKKVEPLKSSSVLKKENFLKQSVEKGTNRKQEMTQIVSDFSKDESFFWGKILTEYRELAETNIFGSGVFFSVFTFMLSLVARFLQSFLKKQPSIIKLRAGWSKKKQGKQSALDRFIFGENEKEVQTLAPIYLVPLLPVFLIAGAIVFLKNPIQRLVCQNTLKVQKTLENLLLSEKKSKKKERQIWMISFATNLLIFISVILFLHRRELPTVEKWIESIPQKVTAIKVDMKTFAQSFVDSFNLLKKK